MFIAIFIAVLLAAGLYFFMKPKKSEDAAKAKFEKEFFSTLRKTKEMAIAMSTPDTASEIIAALQSEVEIAEAVVNELMVSIHQEFGISIVFPKEAEHNYTKPELDIDSIVLKWVSCPKTSELATCLDLGV